MRLQNYQGESFFLASAQMNPDTDFSMEENLIDFSFLAVLHSHMQSDLLPRLAILHPTKFWIFSSIDKNGRLPR